MFLRKLKTPVLLAATALAAIGAAVALALGVFLVRAAPVPKHLEPKPLTKGTNRILIVRNGGLVMIDPTGGNEAKLLADGGFESRPRLSPDGTRVAYCARRDDRNTWELFVAGIGDKKGRSLEVFRSDGIFTLVWSQDGTAIGIASILDTDPSTFAHFVVDVQTGRKTELRFPAGHILLDWGADGRFLAGRYNRPRREHWPGGVFEDYAIRLSVLNRDGTEHRAMTYNCKETGPCHLSPDGAKVLTCDAGRHGIELAVRDFATGKTTAVEHGMSVLCGDYCWSPDGTRIAFIAHPFLAAELLVGTETIRLKSTNLLTCDPDGKNVKLVVGWDEEKGRPVVDWR